jgi:hypothetical protein
MTEPSTDPQAVAIQLCYWRAGKGICIACEVPLPHLKGRYPRCPTCVKENAAKYQQGAEYHKRRSDRRCEQTRLNRETIRMVRSALGLSSEMFNQKSEQSWNERRRDRRANGLCGECGDPQAPGRTKCVRCLMLNAQAVKTRRTGLILSTPGT